MTARYNILLVTQDDKTVKAVNGVVEQTPGMMLADTRQGISDLNAHLSDGQPAVLLVDIDPAPPAILSKLEPIANRFPEKKIVVLSSSRNQELILRAMHAGARHFLRKKTIDTELVPVIRQLMPKGGEKPKKTGSIIAVYSTGGGCGATTVAVNLANELRMASSETVLMIDLDNYYGTLATYLGITGEYGIQDVLAYKGPIDKELIESSSQRYMKNFHVLAIHDTQNSSKTLALDSGRLVDAVNACRENYRYTVIDAPRLEEKVRLELARLSELVVVVFQVTVKDVRYARSMMASLVKAGMPPKKIIPMANRFQRRGLLMRIEDVKKSLGVDDICSVRSDWRKTTSSINQGKPLADVAPWSGLRRDFQKFAAHIEEQISNSNGKKAKEDR